MKKCLEKTPSFPTYYHYLHANFAAKWYKQPDQLRVIQLVKLFKILVSLINNFQKEIHLKNQEKKSSNQWLFIIHGTESLIKVKWNISSTRQESSDIDIFELGSNIVIDTEPIA